MIKKVVHFSQPEYREKKEIYDILGYKEVDKKEYGYKVKVTFEVDESHKNYKELAKIEKSINVKGPIFLPIILFVIGAFVLLSVFVIEFAKSLHNGTDFDVVGNALAYLIPAFSLLLMDVIYTYFYFKINHRLMANPKPTLEEIKARLEEIKSR